MPNKEVSRRAAQVGVFFLCLAVLYGAGIGREHVGVASYYGAGEPLNKRTAMNRRFDATEMGCASWQFPLGSVLEVTSLRTGKKVVVRCTGRGPDRRLDRLVDLTREAFAEIDDPERGLTTVRVCRLK